MEGPLKAQSHIHRDGFTLVEALISIMILTVGFSALYYWFIGYGVMARHDRSRVEAFQIVRQDLEYCTAYPAAAVDSTWLAVVGPDSFEVERDVLDSADALHLADSLGLGSAAAARFAMRPREVNLRIHQVSTSNAFHGDLYFVVGGVIHVAP